MARTVNLKKAVSFIEEKGILLVYPVNNRKDLSSLWSSFFPRSEMKWEWDENGDTRVSDLWMLKTELSHSDKVVYAKWYRGRATFFSKKLFTAMMTLLRTPEISSLELSREAADILDILEIDSPQSTKALKKAADLQGKYYEGKYSRALKELWSRLLIVGYGEVDDGAFPSLALGATKNIFEDLYAKAKGQVIKKNTENAQKIIEEVMPRGILFRKYFEEVLAKAQMVEKAKAVDEVL